MWLRGGAKKDDDAGKARGELGSILPAGPWPSCLAIGNFSGGESGVGGAAGGAAWWVAEGGRRGEGEGRRMGMHAACLLACIWQHLDMLCLGEA